MTVTTDVTQASTARVAPLSAGTAAPPTGSERVEFISQIHNNPSTELAPAGARGIDVTYLKRYVHALEDAGFDYTLVPYGSSGADSFVLASAVGQLSDVIKVIVAVRPNTTFPLVAAQKLATLDQLISGGSDAEQEFFDRALWTRTAAATNAGGAATALVGSPETVAAAILDYIDLGASLVSIRGYDNRNDVIDYGRYVIPLVRQELAHRGATGQRGTLQADHLGNLGTQFATAARI